MSHRKRSQQGSGRPSSLTSNRSAAPPDAVSEAAESNQSPDPPATVRRLDTVTVELVTPDDFPGEFAESYEAACGVLGVEPRPAGYALALALDRDGARFSVVSTDVPGASAVLALWHDSILAGFDPAPSTVVATRPGWPVACVFGLADRPMPHDPEPAEHGPPLRPPEGAARIAAGRRLMADLIAEELATSGGQSQTEYEEPWLMRQYDFGDTDPEPPPMRLMDLRTRVRPDAGSSEPDAAVMLTEIHDALQEAWALSTASSPPAGAIRCRSVYRSTRVVRASGEGWSLVARTEGPAILLLDTMPGTPLEVGEDPIVHGLAEALTDAADRARPPSPRASGGDGQQGKSMQAYRSGKGSRNRGVTPPGGSR